jgi:hypothetical protein
LELCRKPFRWNDPFCSEIMHLERTFDPPKSKGGLKPGRDFHIRPKATGETGIETRIDIFG